MSYPKLRATQHSKSVGAVLAALACLVLSGGLSWFVAPVAASTGTLVTASANSGAILLTATTTGVGTDYTLSSTSSTSQLATFGGPSFSAAPSGSTLAGGAATSDLGDILTSVLVDGSANMTLDQSAPGCSEAEYGNLVAELPYATHTPSVQNVVNGVGGWTTGTSECVTCYLSQQEDEDGGPVSVGVPIVFTSGGQVVCSEGGTIWDPIIVYDVHIGVTNFILASWDAYNCYYIEFCPNGNTAASCPASTYVDVGGMEGEPPCNTFNYAASYHLVVNFECFPAGISIFSEVAKNCQ